MKNSTLTPDQELGYGEIAIQRFKQHSAASGSDFVAREVPVALVFNGISHAVMLATPLDLVDFALGFSFSEGIISQRSEVYEIEQVLHAGLGIEVHLTISSACFMRLKQHRRTLVGRTGCGLCGLESLAAFDAGNQPAQQGTMQLAESEFNISQQSLFDAFHALQSTQSINQITGAMHAAAWVDASGKIIMVREDLGRHNALDKLIGALLAGTEVRAAGCVIMTSRASYELVQKTARAGIPLLATISAPTSLAVEHAQHHGLTLIGFVRNASLVAYAHATRLKAS